MRLCRETEALNIVRKGGLKLSLKYFLSDNRMLSYRSGSNIVRDTSLHSKLIALISFLRTEAHGL